MPAEGFVLRQISVESFADGSFYHFILGERLIHGLIPLPGYRMPLATISTALLVNHSPSWVYGILPWIGTLLLFALGCLTAPELGILPALSVLVLGLCEGGLFSWPNARPEAMYTLLILLVACFLVRFARRPTRKNALALASAIGASLLFRSVLEFFPPLLFLQDRILARGRRDADRKRALIVLIVPYLFLAPWVCANWINYRLFAPFESFAAADNLYAGAAGLVQANETIHASQRYLAHPAVSFVEDAARHPFRLFASFLHRLAYLFSWHPILWTAGVLAVISFRDRPEIRQLGLLCVYWVGLHCLMPIQWNYFLQLWPELAVLAASLAAYPILRRPRPDEASLAYRLAGRVTEGWLAVALSLCLYATLSLTPFMRTPPEINRRSRAAALEEPLRRNPTDAWLLFQRGTARIQTGELRGADDDLTRACALHPYNQTYRIQLGWARMLEGSPKYLLDWRPWSPMTLLLEHRLRLLRAFGYLRARKRREADEELAKILRTRLSADGAYRAWSPEESLALATLTPPPLERVLQELPDLILDRPPEERAAFVRELKKVAELRSLGYPR